MGVAPTIEGFRVQAVKGELLPDEVRGLPLGREALRTIMFKVPIVVSDPSAETDSTDSIVEELQLERGQYELSQPSEMHKRSFVVDHPDFQQTWQDEYGNRYSAISTKGNNFSQPGLHEHPTAAEGVIPFGLQESSIIERVLKASQFIRSKGISTEYIFGVTEPKEFPWPGKVDQDEKSEVLSLDEYKRRIVMDYWTKLKPEYKTIEALGELHKQFEDMTFFVTFRATDSPYRMSDLADDDNRQSVYEYTNEHLLEEGMNPFDTGNYLDDERFDIAIFAPRLGVNFARLHHAGLAHKFPHMGNITALGGIVDLDSVHGEPLGLGNDKIEPEDMAYDINYLVTHFLDKKRVIFTEKNGLDAMNIFMRTYADEIEELSADKQEAKDHMQGLLYMLDCWGNSNHSDSTRILAKEVYRTATLRYSQKYLGADFAKKIDAMKNAIESIDDFFSGAEYTNALERVLDRLPEVRAGILYEFPNEITEAYHEGGEFNIMEQLTDRGIPGGDERVMLLGAILEPYHDKIRAKLDEQFPMPDGLNEIDAKIYDIANELVYLTMGTQIGQYANDILLDKMLRENSELFAEKMLIAYPENVLPTRDSTYVRIDPNNDRGSYFLTSESVELEELAANIADYEVVEGNLEFDYEHFEHFYYTSSEGYIIDQVIADTYIDGSWGFKQEGGSDKFDASFDETPSYIAIVERDSGGQRRIVLLKNKSDL
jgi:tRNA A-37 threonylcarbamoyl transferase component Bud32